MKGFFLQERNILIAIFLNTVVITMLYFPACKYDPLLVLIDHCFVLLFVIELLVKLWVLKPKPFFDDPWNRFDLIVVGLSLPTLIEPLLPFQGTSLLLILRLFRLVRLVRFIRFVPNIGQILNGLIRAIKASVFIIIALFFLNFILALFTCHFYGEIAPEFFGDPLISAYSIFQMFTIEGWNEIPAVIAERLENPTLEGLTRAYFVFVVLVGGIFGMSLANAIFVDEMTMDNNKELEKKVNDLTWEIRELKGMLKRKL